MLIALAFISFLILIVSWVAAPTQGREETTSVMPVHAPQAAD